MLNPVISTSTPRREAGRRRDRPAALGDQGDLVTVGGGHRAGHGFAALRRAPDHRTFPTSQVGLRRVDGVTWASKRGLKTSYPSPKVFSCQLNDGPSPRS